MTGAKLADDLLPRFRVLTDVLRADRVERKLSRFQCAVVAADAIPIDHGAFGRDGSIPRLRLEATHAEEAAGQE
jgi:hypothetical protein